MALQETRLQGKDIMSMMSHTQFYSGKIEGTSEFGVAFVVVEGRGSTVVKVLCYKSEDR